MENQPAPAPAEPPAENAAAAEALDPQPDQAEEMEMENEDDANNGAQGRKLLSTALKECLSKKKHKTCFVLLLQGLLYKGSSEQDKLIVTEFSLLYAQKV